jgi:hypothetical protein
MGTMVGTKVGVGWAVACAETARGFAPIASPGIFKSVDVESVGLHEGFIDRQSIPQFKSRAVIFSCPWVR